MPVVEYRSPPSALVYMSRAVLRSPAARVPVRAPELVLRWRGVRAAPKDVDDVCLFTEEPRSDALPFLYFHVAGFRLQLALLTFREFPLPLWRMLQVRNRLVQHRALPRSARVDYELRLSALRIVEKGLEADLHMTVSESGMLAWESVNTFYARGAFGPATARTPEAIDEAQGPPIAEWSMPTGGAFRFARLTGDYNGLHFSDAYARRFGFARAFLHPQRVLGGCLARLAQPATERRALEAWIRGPVPYGAQASLRASSEQARCRFALRSEIDPRAAILGLTYENTPDRSHEAPARRAAQGS